MIFLFATELEAQPFRLAAPHATIVICGVGAAECAATTALIVAQIKESGEPKIVVLAGIAGSYSLCDVALCEVVEVTEAQIEALPQKFSKIYRNTPSTTLRQVTLNSVNSSLESTTTPISQIEDMEGAAFGALCSRANIEYIHIRAISNLVGEPFSKWKVEEACEALAETLLEQLCGW
ncbi:MAG: hypothetical protein R3Y08_00105 [Rikenellaceae bacterium]